MKINKYLTNNKYPGRGIIVGVTPDGKYAVSAYFIMGRSINSQNRQIISKDDLIKTVPIDSSSVLNPELIIYNAICPFKNNLIITNGTQTDVIFEYLQSGLSFEDALKTQTFEPDFPSYTPRISSILNFNEDKRLSCKMSVISASDKKNPKTIRKFYSFDNIAYGYGYFIHTYKNNTDPLQSFDTSPVCIEISDNINDFSKEVWESLYDSYRISLYVRFTDLKNMDKKEIIINKFNK